ncbi:predicted protein [Uncinocarpus reesii 1704]|uniref:Uncharacterized protein n=1 Tax=Uncinocarpus reesii (strain UAMH 1704) TaxID=336963 RepID=C4JX49_UNCRE|nr:uncharacterized protein UREG_06222 [Uncinocarpus reesii 1704]EEP81357.1 predicted protein [Uncinocarpus reesii 1704]
MAVELLAADFVAASEAGANLTVAAEVQSWITPAAISVAVVGPRKPAPGTPTD